jgi:hypothetical protein
VTHSDTKRPGVEFSPLKGLGVDRWVPGGKRKVLITGGAGQIGASDSRTSLFPRSRCRSGTCAPFTGRV